MKKYLNKKDILHYLKYGPMDFNINQAMFYYWLIEFPIYSIIYWSIHFFVKNYVPIIFYK